MILLDTNVDSEPLRRTPEARVVEWIDEQPLETLYLSAITVAELRAKVALLPSGKRRSGLRENLETCPYGRKNTWKDTVMHCQP